MNEENILVITDREELYDKCENMEQLFDKYYLPLLDKHYSKTYKLQQENARLKDKIEKVIEYIKNIDKYEETLNDDTRVYMIQDVDVDEIEKILKDY